MLVVIATAALCFAVYQILLSILRPRNQWL